MVSCSTEQYFGRSLEIAVHSKMSLSRVEKLVYLKLAWYLGSYLEEEKRVWLTLSVRAWSFDEFSLQSLYAI